MPANFHCHYQYASGRVVCVYGGAVWKMRSFSKACFGNRARRKTSFNAQACNDLKANARQSQTRNSRRCHFAIFTKTFRFSRVIWLLERGRRNRSNSKLSPIVNLTRGSKSIWPAGCGEAWQMWGERRCSQPPFQYARRECICGQMNGQQVCI